MIDPIENNEAGSSVRTKLNNAIKAANANQAGDYGGGEPNYTPETGIGMAIDTSNERIWYYYSGAWH